MSHRSLISNQYSRDRPSTTKSAIPDIPAKLEALSLPHPWRNQPTIPVDRGPLMPPVVTLYCSMKIELWQNRWDPSDFMGSG